MDVRSVYTKDTSHASESNTRNDFLCFDTLIPSIDSNGRQIFRSSDRVDSQVYKESELDGSSEMISYQVEKESSLQNLRCGQENSLSLTLGSQVFSQIMHPYHFKPKNSRDESIPSTYTNAREDFRDLLQQPRRFPSDDYQFCGCSGNVSCFRNHYPSSNGMNIQCCRYLKPAQQLLDEVICVSDVSGLTRINSEERINYRVTEIDGSNQNSMEHNCEIKMRLAKLVFLLDELECRYEQYFHRMDAIISSFEAVSGKGSAFSYTALTIQAMSRHFSNLREAMRKQINVSRQSLSENVQRNHQEIAQHKSATNANQTRETLQRLGLIQVRQVWRPLRGLPENSVLVLRAWLFEHFLHPYPNDGEKISLASKTGLTKNQISNWFINARVRLWKPMIEEMYKEELLAEDSRESCSS